MLHECSIGPDGGGHAAAGQGGGVSMRITVLKRALVETYMLGVLMANQHLLGQ